MWIALLRQRAESGRAFVLMDYRHRQIKIQRQGFVGDSQDVTRP
jgi:hypothetical protein